MFECPDPEFLWNADAQWWEACTKCSRTAWSHEQSDPLKDLKNVIFQTQYNISPKTFPPAMLTESEHLLRMQNLPTRQDDDKI